MANITSRPGKNGQTAYRIRVFMGEAKDGKQKSQSFTWTPPLGMTEKQAEKEVKRQAVLFEEKVKQGLVSLDGKTRFEDYAAKWLETAELAPKARERYTDLLKRINEAIGHIKLENLQAHHLEKFYQNLKEAGIKEKGRYAVANGLDKLMEEKKLTRDKLSKMTGLAPSTVGAARKGNKVSIETADKLASALAVDTASIFKVCEETSGLSDKTIHHHHSLIFSILSKAKRERIIIFNIAQEHVTAPKVQKKEAVYLDDEQARELFNLLIMENDIRVKTSLLLALFSGVRRGELCGLSWNDINCKKEVIFVRRASQYQRKKGVVEVPTKNESSIRDIKLPHFMFEILSCYRIWWQEHKKNNGTKWQGKENRLFVQANGKPINPDTINYWLKKFREKHNLTYFTPHSLRHTFATLQIAAGVDIRTLQARTGHAQASTLTNIYSHALKSADEAATQALEDMLNPVKLKSKTG